MSLFSSYGQTESPFVRVGDNGFVGVDAETSPDKLPEGVVSRAENLRFRTKAAESRPGMPYINWFYRDNYPYDIARSDVLTGTWTYGGETGNAQVTIDSGSTSGTPYSQGYEYLRFDSGLILKATGEESGGAIPVEITPILNGQSASAETFVWCKQQVAESIDFNTLDLTRSIIPSTQTKMTTGVFSDPNGYEYAVVITDTSAWFGRENNRPFEVTIPGGVDSEAFLVQAFDRLFLFRGTGQTVLDYTSSRGTWAELSLVSGKSDESEADEITYEESLPNAKRGLFFQNRMWIFVDDLLYVSDIGTPDRYYKLTNEFRINKGSAHGDIVTLFPFGKYGILAFSSNSIHLIDNVYGDVATNMRITQISSRIGCGAANTVVNVGNSVWFCDQNGDVWSIDQVNDERMELVGRPVSWPIKPAMEERGPADLTSWSAAYHNSYFYLFFNTQEDGEWSDYLPTYKTGFLNRIAVYDTVREAWAGIDVDTNLNAFGVPMHLNYMGDVHLMVVDKLQANLRVIGYGQEDGMRNTVKYPQVSMTTRGYTAKTGEEQQFKQIKIQTGVQAADIDITFQTDGYNETQDVGGIDTTGSERLTYLTWDKTDWDPSNDNNDFDTPYRKDYSVYPSDNTDGIDLQSASGGIHTNIYQDYRYSRNITANGYWAQAVITNTDGVAKIKDVSVAVKSNGELQGDRI